MKTKIVHVLCDDYAYNELPDYVHLISSNSTATIMEDKVIYDLSLSLSESKEDHDSRSNKIKNNDKGIKSKLKNIKFS